MDSSPKSAPLSGPLSGPAVDKAKLLGLAEPIARAHGVEVVDVELRNEGGLVLRFYVEKLGASAERMTTKEAAIDVNVCAEVARELGPALDVAEPILGRYHFEVSTPGVERPLRRIEDYARFRGLKAKLKLRVPVSGQKVVVGLIGPTQGDAISLVDGAKTYEISFEDVISARLVFEFGPAPKPGKSSKGKGAAKGRKHP